LVGRFSKYMPGWRNGSRTALRWRRPQGHGGSIPLPGTKEIVFRILRYTVYAKHSGNFGFGSRRQKKRGAGQIYFGEG